MEQVNKLRFFALLRAGVNGTIEQQDFKDFEWKSAEDFGRKHGVMPLLFDGYKRYYEESGLEAPIEVKLGWYGFAQETEHHYAQHLEAIRTLCSCLTGNGIQIMVLKGYGLSLCYPVPSHRPCGDIDIYCFDDYKKVDETVASIALCKVDRSHHHHTVFNWSGIMVENHYDFVNVYSHPVHKEIDNKLKELAKGEEREISKDGVMLPSPNLSAIFTLVHSGEHFAAEGVTLRHLVDWWLLRKKYEGKIDWDMVAQTLDEFGFGRFKDVWDEISDCLFGDESRLDIDSLSSTAQRVLSEILNPKFGSKLPKHLLADMLFRTKRWFGSRWKMKLVYQNESLVRQFFMHVKEKFINPESKLN